MTASRNAHPARKTVAQLAAFFAIVIVWVLLDQLSKGYFTKMEPGGIIAGPFAGVFDIRLVHNTGGAWGIFSDNTMALGVFSLIVCAVMFAYFIWAREELNVLQFIGLALIVAGGIGNAIDRFSQGFVTDFIEFSFFDFPVFNVADIGVTCGFALLVIGFVVAWYIESIRLVKEASE